MTTLAQPTNLTAANSLSNHDAALLYASLGWAVAPLWWIQFDDQLDEYVCACGKGDCKSPGKHPWAGKGLLSATSTTLMIDRWWRQEPRLGVAVAMKQSGLVALDRDGWKKAAHAETWGFDLRDAAVQLSGSGDGEHYLWRANLGDATPSSGIVGVDTKWDGYVVAAPTLHRSGKRYSWASDQLPGELPDAVLERLLAKKVTPSPEGSSDGKIDRDAVQRGDWKAAGYETHRQALTGLIASHWAQGKASRQEIKDLTWAAATRGNTAENTDDYWGNAETDKLVDSICDSHERGLSDDYRLDTVAPERRNWAQQVDAGMLDGWLDVTELDQLVAPSYLVKGLLDRPVVALLHGDGGVGKSFMSLDVALHVALGRQWRGLRVRQARVAYVYTEGPAYSSRRVAAWCEVNETPVGDLKGRLLVYPKPLDLLGPSEHLEAFSAWVQKAGVGLVVFDTFRRNTVGGDENSAKDVSRALHWASRIVQSNATCLIIHHDNKSGGYSGSTTLHGHVDTRIHLTRHEHDDSVICIESEKERESERAGVAYARLESVQLGVDDDGDPFGSAVFVEADEPSDGTLPGRFVAEQRLNQRVQDVVDVIRETPGCSRNHIANRVKIAKTDVKGVVEEAVERGLVRLEEGSNRTQKHYVTG